MMMQHTQKKFRLDANKDDARDRWFTRNLLAKIAPKEYSKLVTQLDMKIQNLCTPTI